jgi:hypothetical protein
MKKVIRDLPERNFNELNAAQRYLFDITPVIGESVLFTPVIAQMKMPLLPRLMSNKAEREALETTIFTRVKKFFNEQRDIFVQAIEQERNKAFLIFKGYILTDPLPGEYVDNSPMSYDEFKQLCV